MTQEPDIKMVDTVLDREGREPESVIPVLGAIQEQYHYLPGSLLRRVVDASRIRAASLWGVATFFRHFRHKPAGEHHICVCHGTACHVKGSERIQTALERELGIQPGQDTDAKGRFTVEKVACVGCCTLAPVVVIDKDTYGHLAPDKMRGMLDDFLAGEKGRKELESASVLSADGVPVAEIRIGIGSCCVANGSLRIREALESVLRERGISVRIRPVGCVGMCHRTPLVEIVWPDHDDRMEDRQSLLADSQSNGAGAAGKVFSNVTPDMAGRIVRRSFPATTLTQRMRDIIAETVDRLLAPGTEAGVEKYDMPVRDGAMCSFLGQQVHLATESCGVLEPLDLDAYQRTGGLAALKEVIREGAPDSVIERISSSGLRGRGGGGFPAGRKWKLVRQAQDKIRYIICNGDEGDPGAFMDRMLLESYPYRVLEGLAIAAYCVGAEEGFLYIRSEYPLAVERVRKAILRLEENGVLGADAFGSGKPLRLSIREGAGAFVCGEETALIASLEGKRGMPRFRPPYPAEQGFRGKPTCVNNVETLALVPWIIRNGPEKFAALGTEKSKGTKVFALTGKIQRGGLIEVPMGITIREIVEEIGGGVGDGRKFKAVQIGGPSGGCIPAEQGDIPVDYEALAAAGAIMGSGGLVVLDDTDCMVDLARYFLKFTQDQSCGKCTFCRVGTRKMLEILDGLCAGRGQPGDIEMLEVLARDVKRGSLCGLGQTAPNPVLTTIRYFRHEYEEHLQGRCPAGRCAALTRYVVTEDCIGCTICAQRCPVEAIPFTPYEKHSIDPEKCTRCDICRPACPSKAIKVVTPNA